MTTPAEDFLARLDAVTWRLEWLAGTPPAAGLTEPDQPSGERWEWGQVWAHLAEFPAYWVAQIHAALQAPLGDPPPFGRVKTDPDRVAAIEHDRHVPPGELMARLVPQLHQVREIVEGMTGQDWERTVWHQTMGELDMSRVFEEFVVGHLEAHADQLDALAYEPG